MAGWTQRPTLHFANDRGRFRFCSSTGCRLKKFHLGSPRKPDEDTADTLQRASADADFIRAGLSGVSTGTRIRRAFGKDPVATAPPPPSSIDAGRGSPSAVI